MAHHIHIHLHAGTPKSVPAKDEKTLDCGCKSHSTITDEHLGFKKLEEKLAHEKGVTNPAALAAAIGRKKFGVAGMAAKSAAGK